MQITDDTSVRDFQETVWKYYHNHSRDLLWRNPDANGNFDPYKIMLSEIMLQQTQVARVTVKYQEFLALFPTLQSLAAAQQGQVIAAWSGLGYNRRARFLHQAAQKIITEYNGVFPQTLSELITLPGIGKNTAGAIMAYAFNISQPFIETNVRTVLIHHFCNDQTAVSEKDLLALATATIDHEHPREWHWALMDYGSHLKQSVGNLSRQSKVYAKQSTFEGSKRQVRGQVIRLLTTRPQSDQELRSTIPDVRLDEVLESLVNEGLITRVGNSYKL